jgi:hypothetical protein
VYNFNFDCGRAGNLTGMFAVDERGKAALDALIASRREVYFGEVLGKHSEVRGPIDPTDVSLIEATPEEVAVVLRVLGGAIDPAGRPWTTLNGWNPLETLGEHTELVYVDPWDDARFLAACRGEEVGD